MREEQRPEPPLGWQLSREMIERLDGYWNCPANQVAVAAVKNWLQVAAADGTTPEMSTR